MFPSNTWGGNDSRLLMDKTLHHMGCMKILPKQMINYLSTINLQEVLISKGYVAIFTPHSTSSVEVSGRNWIHIVLTWIHYIPPKCNPKNRWCLDDFSFPLWDMFFRFRLFAGVYRMPSALSNCTSRETLLFSTFAFSGGLWPAKECKRSDNQHAPSAVFPIVPPIRLSLPPWKKWDTTRYQLLQHFKGEQYGHKSTMFLLKLLVLTTSQASYHVPPASHQPTIQDQPGPLWKRRVWQQRHETFRWVVCAVLAGLQNLNSCWKSVFQKKYPPSYSQSIL